MNECEAMRTRAGDQMECLKCGLIWDVDDDDPPVCPLLNPVDVLAEFAKLKQILEDKRNE